MFGAAEQGAGQGGGEPLPAWCGLAAMHIPYLDIDLPDWAGKLGGVLAFVLLLSLVHRILFAALRRLAVAWAVLANGPPGSLMPRWNAG